MLQNIFSSPFRLIYSIAIGLVPIVLVAAVFASGQIVLPLLLSLSFLAVGYLMGRGDSRLLEVGATVALIGQSIALTSAFQGHQWQIDTHMLFFALLACVVCLRSVLSLFVAAGLIALHHVSLTLFLPSLIYPTTELIINLERTAFHAVVVVLQTAILVAMVLLLERIDQERTAQAAELQISLQSSEEAWQEARSAQEQAEQSRKLATAAQRQAEDTVKELHETQEIRKTEEAERRKLQADMTARDQAKMREQAEVVDALQLALEGVQSRDLTTRIRTLPAEYEKITDAFNTAIQSLETMVLQVAERSEQMDVETIAISTAVTNLARQTEQQALTLGSNSAAVQELTEIVKRNSDTVQSANASSQTAQSSAAKSGAVVSEASTAMEAIHAEGNEISKIVEVINGISFQTNLLALNAGVEAARAGAAGRGFAVVASEVRSLAQRSSQSAVDIRALIDRSEQQVDNGTKKIADTVASLNAVTDAVSVIAGEMEAIAQSTKTQTDEISTLNASISNLDRATQTSAAQLEETSAACQSLSKNASALREMTQSFRTAGSLDAVRNAA